MKKSFLVHKDSLEVLDDLSAEQCGELFRAIKAYHANEKIVLSPVVKIAFSPFKNQFIRDAEKYEKTCKARADAGSMGGKQRVANASKSKQKVANQADKDSKKDNDSDKDSDRSNILADREFEEVWDLYGKKGNRKTSKPKYLKLSATNKAALLNHIPNYVLSTPDKQFRKDFQTYLNQEAWNDEITQSTAVAITGQGFVEKNTDGKWRDGL